VAFLQLEPSFRSRFSKYPKPKRGIGPGSLKTGAKEGYRPRSNRTRSQKVAGSQGYTPRSKKTRCQKGVNGFGSSNNRSHRVYLGFEIREPFFLLVPAPLQFHTLSRALSLSHALSLSRALSLSLRCTHCHHTLRPPSTSLRRRSTSNNNTRTRTCTSVRGVGDR